MNHLLSAAMAVLLLVAVDLSLAPSAAWAESSFRQGAKGQGQERGGRPSPPPEAIEACSGKSENAACSFTGRRNETVTGVCRDMGDHTVCFPGGGPHAKPGAKGDRSGR